MGTFHVGCRLENHVDRNQAVTVRRDRKSTRLNSSHLVISYAVFCLKKKKTTHLSYLYLPPIQSSVIIIQSDKLSLLCLKLFPDIFVLVLLAILCTRLRRTPT